MSENDNDPFDIDAKIEAALGNDVFPEATAPQDSSPILLPTSTGTIPRPIQKLDSTPELQTVQIPVMKPPAPPGAPVKTVAPVAPDPEMFVSRQRITVHAGAEKTPEPPAPAVHVAPAEALPESALAGETVAPPLATHVEPLSPSPVAPVLEPAAAVAVTHEAAPTPEAAPAAGIPLEAAPAAVAASVAASAALTPSVESAPAALDAAPVATAAVAAAAPASTSAFRLEVEPDGLALLTFDTPGERANKYSTPVMTEFDKLLDELGRRRDIKALILVSAKSGIFIAGADVNEIATASAEFGKEAVRRGQEIFNKLAALPYPTVAAIDGACVGGGCETALAMDWRLASDSSKTRIGLPEVQLGILPAWGGTTRMPRMIGLTAALDIILAGKTLDSRRAKKVGLVDDVVPQLILLDVAKRFAREKFGTPKRSNAAPDGGPLRVRPKTLQEAAIEGLGKGFVLSQARKLVMKQSKGFYPAPLEALKAIDIGFGKSFPEALKTEVEAAGRLIGTPIMRNLVALFFRMEDVKKETGAAPGVKPRTVGAVGVLGAGIMGGGIAQLAADKGHPTRMKDIKPEQLAGGFGAAAKIWTDKLKKRRMTKAEFAGKMSLLSGTLDYGGFESCDVTIEAVLEKMAVKHAVLKEWEAVARPDAIFASNTSTLPISEIASAARHPERVVGMHFFNPVHKMPLVEVIYGARTTPEVTATIFELAKAMGKTPVVVKDAPGFLVNRILAPYIGEAARLLLEGTPMEAIDQAMRAFGMPVGPIELLDDVGIDVAAKGAETLAAAWPQRMPLDAAMGKLVTSGRLGRKTKKGFYLYDGDKRTGPDAAAYSDLGIASPAASKLTADEMEARMIFPMINEAAYCLMDGIVESAAKLDLAMIFGTGFPPFRGGLLKHADTRGLKTVVDGLKRLEASHGPRFTPAQLLVDNAQSGKSFHS